MFLMFRRLPRIQWSVRMRLFSTEVAYKDELIEKLRSSFIKDKEINFVVPAFKKALLYPDDIAVMDSNGEFTYFQLYLTAKRLAIQISNICGSASLSNVAFLSSNSVLWIAIQWSCWISGQVAVPLEPTQSTEQLQCQAKDCKPKLLVATLDCEHVAKELSDMLETATVILDHSFIPTLESVSSLSIYVRQLVCKQENVVLEGIIANDFYGCAPAMLLYTSNAISSPKRVMLTHRNIEVQQDCLIESLRLSNSDCMLPIIPMNRMHTVIGSVLSVGGNVLLQKKFDSHSAWSSLLGINSPSKKRVNIFMAMPIVYKRLITKYDKLFAQDSRMVEYIVNHCKHKIRLMITAFSLLPDSVYYRWRTMTAQKIYEYYGTLETGLVLGHSVEGKLKNSGLMDCRSGILGPPLKGVTARLVNSKGKELLRCKDDLVGSINHDIMTNTVIGELQISGNHLFAIESPMLRVLPEYFGSVVSASLSQTPSHSVSNSPLKKPALCLSVVTSMPLPSNTVTSGICIPNATQASHTQVNDSFLKTGDICAYQNGYFYFLSKVRDIFAVGGYKIYGSEIKRALISHPNVNDVAVVGIPNKVWGHRLGVICIVLSDTHTELDAIMSYCSRRLAAHKCPTVFKILASK